MAHSSFRLIPTLLAAHAIMQNTARLDAQTYFPGSTQFFVPILPEKRRLYKHRIDTGPKYSHAMIAQE